jgi:hypothetical protein
MRGKPKLVRTLVVIDMSCDSIPATGPVIKNKLFLFRSCSFSRWVRAGSKKDASFFLYYDQGNIRPNSLGQGHGIMPGLPARVI